MTTFEDFSLEDYDDIHVLHLVSDFQRLSFSQELSPTLTPGLTLRLGLVWCHFEDKNFFIYTTLKHFSLDVYDDIHVLHLVSEFQRFSFSQEFTLTLTVGLTLRLGLGLGSGHKEKKKFFIYTTFKYCSFHDYDDIYLHLVPDSQRLSFSQVLTPTLTLGFRLPLGLWLA